MIDNENIILSTSASSTSANTTSTNTSGSGIPTTSSTNISSSVGSNSPLTMGRNQNSVAGSKQHSNNSSRPSSRNGSRSGSIKYNTKPGQASIKKAEKVLIKKQMKMNRTNSQKFWRTSGLLLQIIGLAAIVFTIFIGLHLDGYIDWNYWLLFTPVYVLLMACYLATGSRILSNLVSMIVRLVWRLSVFGITIFVVFTILKLKYSLFGYSIMMIPLLFTFGSTFILGLYSLIYAVLFVDGQITPQRKTKYIVNGLPLLFIGMVLTPAAVMISLKLDRIYDAKLAVCFVSLFIGDIISSCFSFFLLLFSLGSKDTATFSIGQLLSIIFITICSIIFKVLLILNIDQGHSINYLFLLIPLLIAECCFCGCGINLFIKPPKTQYLDSTKVEEDSNLIVNDNNGVNINNNINNIDTEHYSNRDEESYFDQNQDYSDDQEDGEDSGEDENDRAEVSFKDYRDEEKDKLLNVHP